MNKRNLAAIAVLSIVVAGCQERLDEPGNVSSGTIMNIPESATIPGVMKVKVSEDLAERLLENADENGFISDPEAAGLSVVGIDIKSVNTTFMIGGKFEARQKKAGLHRWFTITYDDNIPLTRASGDLAAAEGVELTEPALRIKKTSVTMNDPYYPNQWHYNNTGQHGFRSGIDIRLQEAWDTYGIFGNENVTVAIIDGGVDLTHPDLVDNLWTNEAELNGSPNRDDDGNGYRDDVHGYNFVTNSADITGETHGTHVAGTVSACNNNGIGVCGVAGGRYPDQPGVRLMCLQIMDERYPQTGANTARVFQYAADNGAQIAQNSWGYEESPTEMLPSDADAIDYFIDYAGTDENGNQVGPMKGGLVVFAAGNNALDYDYPSGYERVLSVAAIGPNGVAAYYTNYGPWVDVCAPGGDQQTNPSNGGVLSTIPASQYGYLQGTSMACPHVSGLAALVLSVKGQTGFTCQDLFDLIVNSTDPSIYNYNRNMTGQLGKGMINAMLALSSISTEPPVAISHLEAEVQSNTIHFTADVPEDPDNTSAYYYNVYYSTSGFSTDNLTNVEKYRTTVNDAEDAGDGLKRFSLKGLEFNTKYYYAVSASDFAGNESPLTEVNNITTGSNTPPVIEADTDEPLVAGSYGEFSKTFTATDPDGHAVTLSCTLTGNSGVSFKQDADNVVTITVNGAMAVVGTHTFTLTAIDEYGARTDKREEYTVKENHAPVIIKPIETVCIDGIGSSIEIPIKEYVSDEDGGPLSVLTSITDRNKVSYTYLNETAKFTGKELGMTEVSMTVTDSKGASVQLKFNIVVRDNSKPYDIYPNPVIDFLNIRTQDNVQCSVTIRSASGSVVFTGNGNATIDNPYMIDMRAAAPGQYSLVLSLGNEEYRTTFVKL